MLLKTQIRLSTTPYSTLDLHGPSNFKLDVYNLSSFKPDLHNSSVSNWTFMIHQNQLDIHGFIKCQIKPLWSFKFLVDFHSAKLQIGSS